MKRTLAITTDLERTHANRNCWVHGASLCNNPRVCGGEGPHRGRCTLAPEHGGPHIAHNYPVGFETHNPAEIYAAWTDADPDLDMDEGL